MKRKEIDKKDKTNEIKKKLTNKAKENENGEKN